MSRDLVGVTLGKYRCVEFIGLGGMAEVYRAVDTDLDREVAVKVLHPFLVTEDGFVERFRREARTLAALRHPNVVEIYDSGLQEFNSYVVMEYVPGPTLKDRLRELNARNERMSLAEVRRIFSALFAALRYAHQAGVVHRDLKPTNIILAEDGRVVLTDFGLAKLVGSTIHTASMAMIGTPAYMAPEQAQSGSVDLRSDIYALGVILYELLTGSLPFEADTPFAMITKHAKESLPRISQTRRGLPRSIDEVLIKATAKDPAGRFQTVDQFAEALDAAFEGRRLPFTRLRPQGSRLMRVGAAVGAIIVILGVGSASGWFAAASPLATVTPSVTPSPTSMLRARITDLTDLFEAPDRSSRVLAQLTAGTEIALIGQQGTWLEVHPIDSDLTGWVDQNVVFFLPTFTPQPTLTNTPPPGVSLTPTPTSTASFTPAPLPIVSPSPSSSARPTATPNSSPVSTPQASTPTPVRTSTSTSPSATATLPSPTTTLVPSPTPTFTPPATSTPSPSPTANPSYSPTPTPFHPPPTFPSKRNGGR